MIYVKFSCGNGYCGCDIEDVLEFDNGTLEKEIDECIYDIARDNAESYEYVAFGWGDNEIDEEDYEAYYENVDFGWEYITKEEFDAIRTGNY